jgi:hypothetical protein
MRIGDLSPALLPLLLLSCGSTAAVSSEYRDPSGFSLQLPAGWEVRKNNHNMVIVQNPRGGEFAFVAPVLGRTADCRTMLEGNLRGGWNAFPEVGGLRIESTAHNAAVARFDFKGGASRGMVLCAATGARSAMLYALAAPAGRFAGAQPVLASVLKSFRYGEPAPGGQAEGGQAAAPAMPRMVPWREPNEAAYTLEMPEGWRVEGGIQRVSNMDIRGSLRFWSPDGQSLIQFNDTRFDKCLVPSAGTIMAPLGQGVRYCPYQTGLQIAEWYVTQVWAKEMQLENLEIAGRRELAELGRGEDLRTAQAGLPGFQHSYGEVRFRAARAGRPVEGSLLGKTMMLWSPDRSLFQGNYTTEVKGVLAPSGEFARVSAVGGRIESSIRYNLQWVVENRRASARDAQAILDSMRAAAEAAQQAFWERSEAAARRSESVGDLLSGRVRLTDAEGNRYEAKAGSNYYFYDEQAGRTAPRRDDAVLGVDLYPSPLVDLRPLEVVK